MPFAIGISGVILLAAVLNGNEKALGKLLASEFQGNGNFIYWVASIGIIGSVGYVKQLKPISDLFLALLMVVLFLTSGKGFFSQLNSALKSQGSAKTDQALSNPTSSAQTFPADTASSTSSIPAFSAPAIGGPTGSMWSDPIQTLQTPTLGGTNSATLYDMNTGNPSPLYDMNTGNQTSLFVM